MTTIRVRVIQVVHVTLDETKFTPEFMAEFRRHFFDLRTIEGHAEHLAQMYTRGICDQYSFIQGYGHPKDMGITFEDVSINTEVVTP
jgi:hypothetical protein